MDESKEDLLKKLLAEFGATSESTLAPELIRSLRNEVRRKIGEVLKEEGLASAIVPETIADSLVQRWCQDLPPSKVTALRENLLTIVGEELGNDEPHDVTRLLWMWKPEENAQALEEQLFTAIELELRRRVNAILSGTRFSGIRHKISQAELVSELYITLKKRGIAFPPANRRQFFGLVDKSITNILKDLAKHARAAMRPQSHFKQPLLDEHLDQRSGQDQLETLLDAEEMLKLEENIKLLDPREQAIFSLRRNGMSVEEVAETIGCSVATVKLDTKAALAFLAAAQKAS